MVRVKNQTGVKEAKIKKPQNTLKKDARIQDRKELWNRHITQVSRERQQRDTKRKIRPLADFRPFAEALKETAQEKEKTPRADAINPHLKRVVSDRGRKQTLLKEREQFFKVMANPAFQSNPFEAIGKHLSNTMNYIKNLPQN